MSIGRSVPILKALTSDSSILALISNGLSILAMDLSIPIGMFTSIEIISPVDHSHKNNQIQPIPLSEFIHVAFIPLLYSIRKDIAAHLYLRSLEENFEATCFSQWDTMLLRVISYNLGVWFIEIEVHLILITNEKPWLLILNSRSISDSNRLRMIYSKNSVLIDQDKHYWSSLITRSYYFIP